MDPTPARTVQQLAAGDAELLLISPNTSTGPPELFLANVSEAERTAALGPSSVTVPNGCLVVRVADTTVLIDTGGDATLLERLAERGIAPDDIDVVVCTHGHADHVGALLREGAPTFPRARHLMSRAEQTFWTDPTTRAQVTAEAPGHDSAIALLTRALPILHDAGLLHDLADGDLIAPGVTALAAPGHTPGHMVIEIDRDGHRLLHLGDLVSHRLHVDHLTWLPVWDLARAEQVIATRTRILTHGATTRAVVIASHIPTPGHITAVGDRFHWTAVEPVDD